MSASIPHYEAPPAQPRFMSTTRRFGRYDDFKPLQHSTISLGSKSIGKINVDCQFLFQESVWGTLHGQPGGIIHLSLNFGPPSGCRVSDATVTITLDDDDPCLRTYMARRPGDGNPSSQASVSMTEWYGPQCVGGEKKVAEYTSTLTATPELSFLNVGVGGVGYDRAKGFKHEAAWSFSGQLWRGKRTSVYKSLKWVLNENELDHQSFHNPKFRTAFAFEHSRQPFLIKVTIEGKLAKWHHNIFAKMKFDGTREGKIVTLVDFEDHRRFPNNLRNIAESLPLAMEIRNLVAIPIAIPDTGLGTTPSQLQPDTPLQTPGPTVDPPALGHAVGTTQESYINVGGRYTHHLIEHDTQKGVIGPEMRQAGPPLNGVEDFRNLVAALEQEANQKALLPSTTAINTSPLIGKSPPEDLNKPQEAGAPTARADLAETPRIRKGIPNSEVGNGPMLGILSIPSILAFFQFLSGILRVGNLSSQRSEPEIAETINEAGDDSQGTSSGSETKEEYAGAQKDKL